MKQLQRRMSHYPIEAYPAASSILVRVAGSQTEVLIHWKTLRIFFLRTVTFAS